MNPAEWTDWFRKWVARHPVKEPPQSLMQRYAEEVTDRIRAFHTPSSSRVFRWRPQPWSAFAIGTALACALAVLVTFGPNPQRMIRQAGSEWHLLSEVGESVELNGAELEEELQAADRIMLAKAMPNELAEIEETLQLLEELEPEETASASEGFSQDEEWEQDLQNLDEAELAAG